MINEKRRGYLTTDFKTRAEGDKKIIEGYFIRYNESTELWEGFFEMVGPEAVVKSLERNDIRALFNHDTGMVLGRGGAGTAVFENREEGLYGTIEINTKDQQAMDIVARVERGDINQASFGFNIIAEDYVTREDGTTLVILREIDLHEVSVVTFPAYPTTSIQARQRDFEEYKNRKHELKKIKLRERIENA